MTYLSQCTPTHVSTGNKSWSLACVVQEVDHMGKLMSVDYSSEAPLIY